MIYLVRLSVQHYLYNYQWKYIYVLWLAAYLNSWRQSLQWRPLFSIIWLTVSVKFQLYNGMYFFSLRLFCFLHSTFLYFLSICMFISKICSRRNIIICCKYKNIRYISSTRRNKLIKMSSAAINSVSFFFFFFWICISTIFIITFRFTRFVNLSSERVFSLTCMHFLFGLFIIYLLLKDQNITQYK